MRTGIGVTRVGGFAGFVLACKWIVSNSLSFADPTSGRVKTSSMPEILTIITLGNWDRSSIVD